MSTDAERGSMTTNQDKTQRERDVKDVIEVLESVFAVCVNALKSATPPQPAPSEGREPVLRRTVLVRRGEDESMNISIIKEFSAKLRNPRHWPGTTTEIRKLIADELDALIASTPPEARPLTISDDLPDLLFRKCRISQEDALMLAEAIRAMVKATTEAAEAERDAHVKDWADTDIAFRKLCESVMSKEVIYGDSCGVPGILDLAVLLVGKAEERDALKAKLNDLLAVLHRDGGHYTEAHGTEQSWAEAMKVAARAVVGRSELEADRDALKAQLAASESKLARIVEAANADAADLEKMRDGTKLTRHGMVQIIAWQQEEIAELEADVERLRREVGEAKADVERIVVTEGCDAGVVLLSYEGPTHYNPELKGQVYDHEYFSPLGDALIALYKRISALAGA